MIEHLSKGSALTSLARLFAINSVHGVVEEKRGSTDEEKPVWKFVRAVDIAVEPREPNDQRHGEADDARQCNCIR